MNIEESSSSPRINQNQSVNAPHEGDQSSPRISSLSQSMLTRMMNSDKLTQGSKDLKKIKASADSQEGKLKAIVNVCYGMINRDHLNKEEIRGEVDNAKTLFNQEFSEFPPFIKSHCLVILCDKLFNDSLLGPAYELANLMPNERDIINFKSKLKKHPKYTAAAQLYTEHKYEEAVKEASNVNDLLFQKYLLDTIFHSLQNRKKFNVKHLQKVVDAIKTPISLKQEFLEKLSTIYMNKNKLDKAQQCVSQLNQLDAEIKGNFERQLLLREFMREEERINQVLPTIQAKYTKIEKILEDYLKTNPSYVSESIDEKSDSTESESLEVEKKESIKKKEYTEIDRDCDTLICRYIALKIQRKNLDSISEYLDKIKDSSKKEKCAKLYFEVKVMLDSNKDDKQKIFREEARQRVYAKAKKLRQEKGLSTLTDF